MNQVSSFGFKFQASMAFWDGGGDSKLETKNSLLGSIHELNPS
jgi:hypothetical protein